MNIKKTYWKSHKVYQQHFDTFTPGVSKYHINMLNVADSTWGSAKFLDHLHPNHSATWRPGWPGLPGLPTAQKTVAVVSQLWRRKVHGIAMHHHRAWLTDWALTGQGVSRIGNTMAVAQVAQVAQAKRHCNRISHLAKYSQKTCRMVLHTDYVPSTTKPEVQAGCINNCIIQ